jgi:hypothetical protein
VAAQIEPAQVRSGVGVHENDCAAINLVIRWVGWVYSTFGACQRYLHTRSAVICMSIVPWHAPLKISVCIVPESDPSGWGV